LVMSLKGFFFLVLGRSEIFGGMKVLVAAEDIGGVKGKDPVYNDIVWIERVNEGSI
jgi:hypothetical protein